MNIFMAVATATGNNIRVRQLNDMDFYFVVFEMAKLGRQFRNNI